MFLKQRGHVLAEKIASILAMHAAEQRGEGQDCGMDKHWVGAWCALSARVRS